MRSWYPLLFRLGRVPRWLLWYSNAEDGVWTSEGTVPVFDTLPALARHAASMSINLITEEPVQHDLDVIEAWLRSPSAASIDAAEFLNAWNLFSDLARSLEAKLPESDQGTRKTYDKLFWANNLPSVTPAGRAYEPMWDDQDVARMAAVLGSGLGLVRSAMRLT